MMRSFLRQPLSEQRLLLRALLVVVIVRLGLWVLPFKMLREKVESMRTQGNDAAPVSFVQVKKIASAVKRTSRYVPAASCLTQALAAKLLLSRLGVDGILRIGVAKGSEGKFEAHAWLESKGRIIIGKNRDLHRYTVLTGLEEISL
jgi:hypothetical protein